MSSTSSVSEQQLLRTKVAEEIRALMARRNISRQRVARALGVSHTTVWRRLNGDTALNLDELELIATVLGVSVHDLMPREVSGHTVVSAGAAGALPTTRKPRPPERTGRTDYPGHSAPDQSTRHPVGFLQTTRTKATSRPMLDAAA
jgi:transcriptional regulator with XRE-family HTH domain